VEARYRWIRATAAAPSPIAPPTRFAEPERTSPTANTPGTVDSSGSEIRPAAPPDEHSRRRFGRREQAGAALALSDRAEAADACNLGLGEHRKELMPPARKAGGRIVTHGQLHMR
jgi:hypothetical protein